MHVRQAGSHLRDSLRSILLGQSSGLFQGYSIGSPSVLTPQFSLQALSAKACQGPPVLYYSLANCRGPCNGPELRWNLGRVGPGSGFLVWVPGVMGRTTFRMEEGEEWGLRTPC